MNANNRAIDKKISVIIPVYNGGKYIAKAIKSIVAQTLPPDEIIVVNDGSTDDSARILTDLAKDFPIKYYQKENGGQASARNYGVRVASGELIAFLDQDDVWYPHHLEELVKPFLENYYPELGWTYSTLDEIGEDDELYRLDVLSYCDAKHPKTSLVQCLSTDMFVIPSVTLVLKKAFDDVGGFDEKLSGYEDDDLFLRLFSKGYGNVFIDKSLAQWRIHDKSCSWESRMSKSRIYYAKKLLDKYEDNYVRGLRFRTEIIIPRFINVIFGEIRQAMVFKNAGVIKQMKNDLCELYSYMNVHQKVKCKIILLVLQYQPFEFLTKILAKIYWRINKIV